ncbi:MAG: quinol:electron acceptor oxidoreductase subunit ActD [Dehalococcoidia bacterium]
MAQILGLFKTPELAADAAQALKQVGFDPHHGDYDILTGCPYPEEVFGEHVAQHHLFLFPIIGAICGFVAGILITGGMQLTYPMITGGKPILSLPPMVIITYEGTMLGAIIFTILGTLFESRLPNLVGGVYDPRITTDGLIGVVANGSPEKVGQAESIFQSVGAEDVVREAAAAGRTA